MNKLRYCIVSKNDPSEEEKNDAAGFYQWLHIFQGTLLNTASNDFYALKDGDYDMIHFRLTKSNADLPDLIRRKLGTLSKTKLAVTIDAEFNPVGNEFNSEKKLIGSLAAADILFAAEYSIARRFEELTGQPIYELPHPADISRLMEIPKYPSLQPVISFIYIKTPKYLKFLKKIAACLGFKIQILLFREKNKLELNKESGVQIICCQSEREFYQKIASSTAIIAPDPPFGTGEKIIYAAAAGRLVLGNMRSNAIRRCYPFTAFESASIFPYLLYFARLQIESEFKNYIMTNAENRVHYYNRENMKKRFLDFLFDKTGDDRFNYQVINNNRHFMTPAYAENITHIQGEQKINYSKTEFAVICLLKDGMAYLPIFIRHYQKLGARHFYFIDNGSTDKTLVYLKQLPNVTLYTTLLEHKKYEAEIRQTVIEENCRNRWCLCVDIDELFDYPFSDRIPMDLFLYYLNQHYFTSLIAYMLDMFPSTFRLPEGNNNDDFEKTHVYYDISNIKKGGYFNHATAFCNYNRMENKKMKYYYGGIRKKIFPGTGNKYLLIKHPLMYIDKNIEAVVNPHYCNKAYLADVNGLIKHYKFVTFAKTRLESCHQNYDYFASKEYQAYLNRLNRQKNLDIYSSNARRLNSVNDLVKNKFLQVSRAYLELIGTNSDLSFSGQSLSIQDNGG